MADMFTELEQEFFGEIPQPFFDFPAALTEKYRPQSIADFVGLEKPRAILSSFLRNPFPSNWLFIGPSGVGKTTMALAIAKMLPAELHHIPSQECNLERIARISMTCQYVPMAGCKMHLILVDEADRMSDAARTGLLSKLDSTNPLPNTIWIFTCNSDERFDQAFLSRNRRVEFKSRGIVEDAAALLQRVWEKETHGAPAPNFERIVRDSSNNVRESLMRLETEIMAVS